MRVKQLMPAPKFHVFALGARLLACPIFRGGLCLALIGGALPFPPIAGATREAQSLERQIQGTKNDINKLEGRIKDLNSRIKSQCSPPSYLMRSDCRNWKNERRQATNNLQSKKSLLEDLKNKKQIWGESLQQPGDYEEAVKKKVQKQERVLTITKLLSAAAAGAFAVKCSSTNYWACIAAVLSASQAMKSGKKAAELDDVCRAMGNDVCNPGPPSPPPGCTGPSCNPGPPGCTGPNCSPGLPPPPPIACNGPPSICGPGGPGGPGGPLSPSGFSPNDVRNLNKEIAGCNFDPGCFQAGPDGSLLLNKDILPEDLKDAEFAGGNKKVSSGDVLKRISPKQKAKFVKTTETVQSQNKGLVAEMQKLKEEILAGGGDDSSSSGKIAGGDLQGSKSAKSAAKGKSHSRPGEHAAPEEDSISRQVKALLKRAKGKYGKKGKKDKGLAGKAVTIGGARVGAINDNIFLMMNRRYQERREKSQFIEGPPKSRQKTSENFILKAMEI